MKRILLLLLLLLPIVVLAQYPTFSNKQKLGVQTTGDGLIFRGTTINNIPNYTPSNVNNAYFHLDTTTSKLYLYSVGTWQQVYPTASDTTSLGAYLLKSDTLAMLLPYLRKSDTISLSNRINLKLNISDTTILSNRITTNANNIITINNKLATKLDTIYTKFKDVVTMIENKDTINIGSSLTDGYGINIIGDSVNVDTTIIFTQSDTITLSNRIDTKLNVSDTVSLSNRIDLKLNKTDTINLSNRIDLKLNKSDTISLSNRIDIKLNASDTVSLSNRINTKLDTIYVNYPNYIDTITNKDTIQIAPSLVLTEGFGINIIGDSINIDSAVILETQQKQIAYVKNQSGVTMYKGQAVYSSGSTGDNKLVQLASSNTEQASSKTFGIVETDSIPNGGHGYIITFGVLSGFNTSALSEGYTVYLSSTPGQLTTTKPQAPLHIVTIGVCIRQQQNTGSIFVKIQNGFEFDELHDVRLTNLVDKASIYYNLSEDLWRDTTAALLVSDTASMLSKYVNTYSNQTGINGNKTFNNVVTIDSATVTGKLLVNTNISDAVKINSNTNSTNLELANNSGNSVFIKSSNRNMTLQTDTIALMYLNGETNRVGILTMSPEQALEVAGTIRVDSLGSNTLTPTKLVGANDVNDLSDVKLGTGLSFSNDTLKIADNIINSGDTATLLRKDFLGINTNVLVWTEGNKKLLPYFTQVYRNGQLLKSDSQYTITNDSIVTLEEGSYKLGDNITIIAIDNIVALVGGGGIITLQGDVTGSGTSSITTTIGANKVTNTMLAGSISDSKLNTITTVGKVSNTATTATNSNTANTIVLRDGSGDFSARNITATNFFGNATTSTTATIANGVQSFLTTGIIKLATPSNSVQPIITVPDVNATMATTNLSQTFGGTQTFSNTISGSISGNAATVTSVLPSNFASQTANTVLAAPNGSSGTPTFRSLVSSDIPNLNYLPLTGGTLTGGLTGTTGTFSTRLGVGGFVGSPTLFTSGSGDQEIHFTHSDNIPGRKVSLRLTNNNHGFFTFGGLIYALQGEGLNQYNRMSLGINTTEVLHLTRFSRVGIMNNSPSYTLDVNGTFNATGNSLIGGTLGVTSNITANSFIKSGGLSTQFLKADGSVDANTYLTTSLAASTYLPLIGGTVSGTINRAESNYNENSNTFYFNILNYFARKDNNKQGQTAQITFTDRPGTSQFPNAVRTSDIYLMTAHNWNGSTYGQYLDTTLSVVASQGGGNVGIGNLNPAYKLDVNGTLGVTGATTLSSTLGVTGIATLNNILTINSGANTNSLNINNTGTSNILSMYSTNNNSFTRSEYKNGLTGNTTSDGLNVGYFDGGYFVNYENTKSYLYTNNNANQLVLDTDGNVGVGIADATDKLDVNGTLRVRTTNTIVPTSILGRDNNGVVGGVSLGNSLNLSSGTLNVSSKITDINTSQYTILSTDFYIDNFNNSSTTIILPLAGLNVYRELKFKNSSNGALIANGNIVPLSGSGTTTTILPATNAKWCTLVSDGSFWRIMQSN